MPLPCNNVSVTPIKVSQLVRYSNLDGGDILLTIESGSLLWSRRSTVNDLKVSMGKLTGSYSGSFTGSFKGKSSGSFSGSYWGKIISKNTKASGSFSGSFYGISNFSKTASYLRQTNQNTTNGVGYYDGTRLTSAPGLIFDNNIGGAKSLSISSSLPFNYLKIASRGFTSLGTKYNQAGISLSNYNSSEPYPTYDAWTLLSATSGSLTFIAPIGSNAFSSSTIKAQSTTGECYGMVQRRNGFYFWPYMVSNTPARDGAIGIGVQPPEEATGSFDKYLRAKLQINMFSGSGEGPWSPKATVENRSTAILVQYGSGSATTGFTKTFFVSGSGNTYIHGKLNVNRGVTGSFRGINNITNFRGTGKSVSVNATSSYSVYAVSSSYAQTASYLNIPSNGGSPIAFAFASWTGTAGGGTSVTPLSSYNIGSITRQGTQPVSAAQNANQYCDILFTNPCIDANYTVLSYCSWNSPNSIALGGASANTKWEGDIGSSIVSNRTVNGFRVTVFTGWHAGSAGDGDDYWFNTSQFPDYNSFVVFR
jgi:hypothetical protein